MGYTSFATTRVPFVSDPAFYAEIKAHGSMGESEDLRKVLDAAVEGERPTQTVMLLMERNVVSWNVTDDTDTVLPITQETLLLLRVPDFNAILSAINERDLPPETEEEAQKKGTSSPPPTTPSPVAARSRRS